jgi:hypothetical protein
MAQQATCNGSNSMRFGEFPLPGITNCPETANQHGHALHLRIEATDGLGHLVHRGQKVGHLYVKPCCNEAHVIFANIRRCKSARLTGTD